MPIQPKKSDCDGKIIVYNEYLDGLSDLEGFSHIHVLYHFHKSQGYKLSVTPFLDNQPRGVFATRAPRRPNAIGLSILRLIKIEDNVMYVKGLDVLDQTPVLDIKPYSQKFDVYNNTTDGWLEKSQKQLSETLSDKRFDFSNH